MASRDVVRVFARQGEENQLREPSIRRGHGRRIRTFQSSLGQYLEALEHQRAYQPMGTRASFEAVNQSLTPANLFVIALLPPAVYPSGTATDKVSFRSPRIATFDVARLPTRRASSGSAGVQGLGVANVNDQFVQAVPDEGVQSRAYVQSLAERVQGFERDVRNGFAQLDSLNTSLVKGRRQERDMTLTRSEKLQNARNPFAQEDLRYLREQAEAIQNLPPLALLVNPESLSRSYTHRISDGNSSRSGYIVEHWGLDQPTLSASGTIGAYMINNSNALGEGTGGLFATGQGSASFQHFMTLYQIYRHNGYILNEDQTIALVGAVQIFYKGWIYTGSFNSFSIEFSEDSPFRLNYSFDFTVRTEVDTRRK